MGDRVRLGELLAAIGSIGLAGLLAFGGWFGLGDATTNFDAGNPAYAVAETGKGGATHLGWFAFATCVIAAAAGLVFIIRAVTSRTPDRAMLQGPIAFAFGWFASIVVVVRLVVFSPGFEVVGPLDEGVREVVRFDAALTTQGWLGLVALLLIPIGTWIALADERTGSAAAKRRTAELLADVPARTVSATPPPSSPATEGPA